MIVILVGFFGCPGKTALDMGVAGGFSDRLYGHCVINLIDGLSDDLGCALERYALNLS